MSGPELVIIAALAEKNRVIGSHGTLPWSLPEDLKRFRELTTGHSIIMGRVTWEAGLQRRSLPHRHSIVVSNTLPPQPPEFVGDRHTSLCIVPSLEAAFQQVASQPIAFIIGGASIFEQTLDQAHRLELSLVQQDVEGDAYFPDYQERVNTQFRLVHQDHHDGFRTETYRRL